MKRDKKPQSLKEQLRLSFHTITDMVGRDIEKRRQAFSSAEHFPVKDVPTAKLPKARRHTRSYGEGIKNNINSSCGYSAGAEARDTRNN